MEGHDSPDPLLPTSPPWRSWPQPCAPLASCSFRASDLFAAIFPHPAARTRAVTTGHACDLAHRATKRSSILSPASPTPSHPFVLAVDVLDLAIAVAADIRHTGHSPRDIPARHDLVIHARPGVGTYHTVFPSTVFSSSISHRTRLAYPLQQHLWHRSLKPSSVHKQKHTAKEPHVSTFAVRLRTIWSRRDIGT